MEFSRHMINVLLNINHNFEMYTDKDLLILLLEKDMLAEWSFLSAATLSICYAL